MITCNLQQGGGRGSIYCTFFLLAWENNFSTEYLRARCYFDVFREMVACHAKQYFRLQKNRCARVDSSRFRYPPPRSFSYFSPVRKSANRFRKWCSCLRIWLNNFSFVFVNILLCVTLNISQKYWQSFMVRLSLLFHPEMKKTRKIISHV